MNFCNKEFSAIASSKNV